MSDDEIMVLVTRGLQDVLALDDPPSEGARFDRDLHADSLDLMEVIERVEHHLRGQGIAARVDDDVLAGLTTVGEAVAAVSHAVAAVSRGAGRSA